jgi:glycosyltransferase involved in cell wall biosynthesis
MVTQTLAMLRIGAGVGRMTRPSISVVLTVRDGADTIDDQLAALARQTISRPWEIVVVDNGSRDATVARVQAWRSRLPALRGAPGPLEPSRAASLNLGVAAARADRLAFCDHDDVVSDGWASAMCEALGAGSALNAPPETSGYHAAFALEGGCCCSTPGGGR